MIAIESHGALTTVDDGSTVTLVIQIPIEDVPARDWASATHDLPEMPDFWGIYVDGGVVVWRTTRQRR